MDEAAFWIHLEFRVCAELAHRPERELRRWWCDGFIPVILRSEGRPRIEGKVWMAICARTQWQWSFTLFVRRRVRSSRELDWARLLPREGVSGWLSLDFDRCTATIDPTSKRLPIRVLS